MAQLPEYLEVEVSKLSDEIIAGYDIINGIIATTPVQYLDALKNDRSKLAARINALTKVDCIDDDNRARVIGLNRAIKHFEEIL